VTDPIDVLFITGSGRSGSTVLQNILGQVDGVFAAGELRYIWEISFMNNRLCGCGVPFAGCPQWHAIVQTAFGGIDRVDASELYQLTESYRLHQLPTMLLPGRERAVRRRLQPYLDALARLYDAIQRTTGCRWILDSSKNPAYGYVLTMLPNVRLTELHFVRDPRAVAYSWSKQKLFEPANGQLHYMPRYHPSRSAWQWVARNTAAETLLRSRATRYLRLHYEEFARAPQETMQQVLQLIAMPEARLPFVGPNQVELAANHSVFGNIARFRTGRLDIALDETWKQELPPKDRTTVTRITYPLLARYGYLSGEHAMTRYITGDAV
jgi:hypothetical protein